MMRTFVIRDGTIIPECFDTAKTHPQGRPALQRAGTKKAGSTKKMTDPILIVGAGPTGLTLAIELARRGVPFHLIDRRLEPQQADRAAFVKSRSLEIFAEYGLAEAMIRDGQIINGFDIFSGGARKTWFRLGELDSPFPFFLGISEAKTEQRLTEKLEGLGGRIERGVGFADLEQAPDGVRVRLQSGAREEERAYSWLVAADGAHSHSRACLGLDFAGHDYAFHWGVIDGHIANWQQPGDIVASQFDPLIYAVPIGNGRRRIYFRANPQGDSDPSYVEAQLAMISPGLRLEHADPPRLFHAACRIAARYRLGRVLLAGDAAHAISPTQAHGMNTGIQDAYNLGWKLALIAQGLAPDTLLDSYETERRPVAETVSASGDDMESLIAKGDPDATNAIQQALATGESRAQVAMAEAEIAYSYPGSAIVEDHGRTAQAPHVTQIGCRVGDAA